jgi:hypothetical protein
MGGPIMIIPCFFQSLSAKPEGGRKTVKKRGEK